MAQPMPWLKEVARQPKLMKLTYRVAIRMAFHADFDTGKNCRPGAQRVADEIGLDRNNKNHVDQVADCIRELEREGFLKLYHRSRGRGDANGYYLTTRAAQAAREARPAPVTPRKMAARWEHRPAPVAGNVTPLRADLGPCQSGIHEWPGSVRPPAVGTADKWGGQPFCADCMAKYEKAS